MEHTADGGTPDCPICQKPSGFLREVEHVAFFRCGGCGSLFAHPDFLDTVDRGAAANYGDAYWALEIASARERSYGGSIVRVAETLRLARIPVRRFLDIGSGPGFLLDALKALLPNMSDVFHGIELLPPPLPYRSTHPNYRIGSTNDLDGLFDAGICVEVIEHLTPKILSALAHQLAGKSTPGALYFFNSAQPSFVDSTDPGYLDPRRRGHIVSWSIAGAREIFSPAGFNIIPLPGRDWAFLAEYGPRRELTADDLMSWLWHPVPENVALSQHDAMGPLFATFGLESARCYLEAALSEGRGHWAVGLERQLREARIVPAGGALLSDRSWLGRLRSRFSARE
jgi:SAM-dependent methyltransferase